MNIHILWIYTCCTLVFYFKFYLVYVIILSFKLYFRPHSNQRKLLYILIFRNRLENVPEWVCESRKLEVLDIGHNQICELPAR